jgi:integrase
MDMLDAHLSRRGLTPSHGDELVFVTAEGEGLDYSHWRQRVWLPATRHAGFAGLQFHDLRRTAATALVTERIDIKTAQVRLGHADPRTTLGVYAQATREADRDAAERLGVHFRPPPSTPGHRGPRDERGMDPDERCPDRM